MGTAAAPAFDTEALRRGIEGHSAADLLSLYADDAELRIVDRNTQPSHPMVKHGRAEIAEMLEDVYSRDMTHTMDQCVVQGDHVAYTETCVYADGVRVLSTSLPPNLAVRRSLPARRERNFKVVAYSQLRSSAVRCVATVLEPRFALMVTVPEQPWEGETVGGLTRRPVARYE